MRQWTCKRSISWPARRGFTLIELLMVITILAVLGGLALSMIGGARHEANAARTETQIRRIKQFIDARLEDYTVRMLPFRPASPNKQWARNRILIEYARTEMPCRLSQITGAASYPSAHFQSDFNTDTVNFDMADIGTLNSNVPAMRTRMIRELIAAPAATTANEQAECLYEILNSHNDYGSSGLDFIFRGEIGDKDGDGHKEILDAWGDPMMFTLHMLDQEANTLDDFDTSMNTDGPISIHVDVTSVNMP